MSLARIIYEIFYDQAVAYSIGYKDASGKHRYTTEKEVPELADVQEHLDKIKVMGAYTLQAGNMVSWLCFDIDSKIGIDEARKLALRLENFFREHNLPFALEFSGSKGYHAYSFFKDKESGAAVKEIGDKIHAILGFAKTGDLHVEVFPKQGETSDTNPFGNLLRLPLGKHPGTEKDAFFVNTTEWEDGPPIDPEKIFSEKTTLEALKLAVAASGHDLKKEVIGIMTPHWKSGQRHQVAMCLSGALATGGWSKDEVIKVITEIHDIVGDGDLKDQLKAVDTTYKKFHNGDAVLGIGGLAKIMPTGDLNELMEVIGKGAASSAMLELDNIRLSKGAIFLKVRSAARNVIQHLVEDGRIVRDENDLHWLNHATHNLLTFNTEDWKRYLHNTYGINLSEPFGKQVLESLRHTAYDRAKEVLVKKRSYWDGTYDYMNMGGSEIYILEGDPGVRRTVYNGEIDILFKNTEDNFHLPNLQLSSDPTLSPWPYLIDDVNFEDTEDGMTAIQQAQIVKGFFICTFFAEIMPIKPILTFMAESGMGKTTTARRLLKIQEGPGAEVLSPNDDKPDSFRASIAHHRYLVLDNLDEFNGKWLPDMLNRVATGLAIELRELHTTNSIRKFIPSCFMSMTTTKMPFSNETVYSRMLPVRLGSILHRKTEDLIQSDLVNNFNGMWKGLLNDLDEVVHQLRTIKTVDAPNEVRLADFAVFCGRIQGASFLDGKALVDGIGNLTNRQKYELEKNSTFIEILQHWLRTIPGDKTDWLSVSEIYERCQKIALMAKIDWRWTSVQALAMHIKMLEPQLIKNFGMSKRIVRENGRNVPQYKFLVSKIDLATGRIVGEGDAGDDSESIYEVEGEIEDEGL